MADLDGLLERLEQLLFEVEQLEDPLRGHVFELLDGVDTLHRLALGRLAARLDAEQLRRAWEAEPAVAWLLDAYGIDRRTAAPPAVPVELGPTRRRR
jgi:hypothetical protein